MSEIVPAGQSPAPAARPWWVGVAKGVLLRECHYSGARNPKEYGVLEANENGIEYKGPRGGAKVLVPWEKFADLDVIDSRVQHGRQRSAIGVGPIGVAVVGATALANRRNAKIDHIRAVQVTESEGGNGRFIPKDPSESSFRAVIELMRQIQAQRPSAPNGQAPLSGTVSQEDKLNHLKQLGELRDSGVLSPEEFEGEKAKILSAGSTTTPLEPTAPLLQTSVPHSDSTVEDWEPTLPDPTEDKSASTGKQKAKRLGAAWATGGLSEVSRFAKKRKSDDS